MLQLNKKHIVFVLRFGSGYVSGNSSSSDVPCTLERRRSLRSSTPVKIGGVQFVRSPSPTGNGNDSCSTPFGPVAVGKGNKFGFKQQRKPRQRQDVKQENDSMNATESSSNTTNNEQKLMENQYFNDNKSLTESQNQSMTESTAQMCTNQSMMESSNQASIKSFSEIYSNQSFTESTAVNSTNQSITQSSNQSMMESSVQSYRNQSITESTAFNSINQSSTESFTNQSMTKSTNQSYSTQSSSVLESTNQSIKESMIQNSATQSYTESKSNSQINQSIRNNSQSNEFSETQMFESSVHSSSTSKYSNTHENGFIDFGLYDSKGIDKTNKAESHQSHKLENSSLVSLSETGNNTQSFKSEYQKEENKNIILQDHEIYKSEVNEKCNFTTVQKPIKGWQSQETTTNTNENLKMNLSETNKVNKEQK